MIVRWLMVVSVCLAAGIFGCSPKKPPPKAEPPRSGVIHVSAVIDHKETLMLHGNELWFKHRYGTIPTDVTVNGKPADLGYPANGSDSGDSKKITFSPPLPSDRPFHIEATGAPDAEGQIIMVSEPRPENNYTAVFMLYDPREGSRKWDMTIKFDAQ
jgi:hypothetical protein